MNDLKIIWDQIIEEAKEYNENVNSAFFADWMDLFESPDTWDEKNLMLALVYSWQQSSYTFNDVLNKCPTIYTFWMSKFVITNDEKLYRRIRLKRNIIDGDITEEKVNEVLETHYDFVSCSKSIEWMDDEHDHKIWSSDEYYICIFSVNGSAFLPIDEFRDMGEEEIIVYNPVMTYLGLLEDMIR